MRAFSTANGGVMFVSDHIERLEKPVSYKDLVKEPNPAKPFFGKAKKDGKQLEAA